MRALAVIDGEHYAPVVRDALAALPYEFVGALARGRHREAARRRGLRRAARGRRSRPRSPSSSRRSWSISRTSRCSGRASGSGVASRVLALGPAVRRARTSASTRRSSRRSPLPSLAVIGTGKRVGKTAVTGHLARLLARDRDVVVVAMGRGGPPEPELAEVRPTLERLLELSRDGRHAASDYLETAALAGVVTIGCRRCRRRPRRRAGRVERARRAPRSQPSASPTSCIFDGSGAAIPPIDVDARVLVTSAAQPVEVATGYLNAYRILVSDLVRRRPEARASRCWRRSRDQGRAGRRGRAAAAPASSRSPAGGSRTSRPRRPQRTRRSGGTCARSTAPRSCSSPATSRGREALRAELASRSTRRSTSSRSRPPRSTSSRRRRSSAACEVVLRGQRARPGRACPTCDARAASRACATPRSRGEAVPR